VTGGASRKERGKELSVTSGKKGLTCISLAAVEGRKTSHDEGVGLPKGGGEGHIHKKEVNYL